MSHETIAFIKPFAFVTLPNVLCALLLVHSMAVRFSDLNLREQVKEIHSDSLMQKNVEAESKVLQSISANAEDHGPGPRCGLMSHGTEKRYYFDLPSADPARPEDDRAVVLYRDPHNPKIVVYNHAHWRITQKTKDAKIVGLPQWAPVDSSPKVPQAKYSFDLYKDTQIVRQSMQDNITKFELVTKNCAEKVCGLSFAGGTFYPTKSVKAALHKVGTVWKDKEKITMNSSDYQDVHVEPTRVSTRSRVGKLFLLSGLVAIPAVIYFGEAGLVIAEKMFAGAGLAGGAYALLRKKLSRDNNASAAAKLFEKIYCLSAVSCSGGRSCMARCKDPENLDDYVVMPRSNVVYATNFTCK